jgi:peptide chain release factor subunit 1
MAHLEQLTAQLDRLAAFDPGPFPVLSLYLNLQPDDRGRDRFESFLRKELTDRVGTYAASAPERESLEKDASKIEAYAGTIPQSANGLAVFACSGADLFEAIPLAAPVDDHRMFISDQPHLYPLARLLDEYPRYLALLADTHSARIFVFAVNAVERTDRIEGTKTKRHKMGGWSQARYQRHIENYHLHHAKEIVDTLARTVRDDGIEKIVIAGDDVIVPLLREQLPKDVAERIVDVVRLDINAPERTIVETTIAALREKDAETDRERVEALIGAYRANGLACVGVEQTRRAFELGQVDELVITASPDTLAGVKKAAGDQQPDRSSEERAADELIVQARNTSAKTRFIQDESLLAPIGGVGAFLRFKTISTDGARSL